jgi:CubicO group peptidase (beta-lactamase class C family)
MKKKPGVRFRTLTVLAASISIAGLLSACANTPWESARGTLDRSAQLDQIFAQWNVSDSPGCAVAVIEQSSSVYRSYGMADLDHGIRISSAPVFHAASLAKQFTATAILLLARDGQLSLDDPVRKYIPELPDFGYPLTIRHLLHHTSGLRDQWVLLTMAGWRLSDDVVKTEDVLSLVARMKALNFRPGDRYLYSNTGYTLAAVIVERVSRRSLRDFSRSKIFGPLGMHRTVFREVHGEIVYGHAYGYRELLNEPFEMRMPNYDLTGPTNLLTTVEDLAKWERALRFGAALGLPLVQQLQTRGTLNDGTQIPYAMGLFAGHKYRGLDIIEHDGRDAGYRSHFIRFPGQHFAVACLCNLALRDDQLPGRLVRRVADVYLAGQLGPPTAPPSQPVSLSTSELTARAGAYWAPSTHEIARVVVEQTSLRLDFRGSVCALEPLGGGRYKCGLSWEAQFTPSSSGGPGSMVLLGANTSIQFDTTPAPATGLAALSEYEGGYYSAEIDTTYRVRLTGTSLAIERQKYPATPLEPIVLDVFAFDRGQLGLLGPGSLRYTRDARGKINGFLLDGERVRNFGFVKAAANCP